MKKNILIFLAITATAMLSQAEPCVLKIKRTACPGKEAEAFKPYNGKEETEETKDMKDVGSCEKAAEKAAKIVRKGVLVKKVVTGTFGGKGLGKAEYVGENTCK